jgi:hypothetical protein
MNCSRTAAGADPRKSRTVSLPRLSIAFHILMNLQIPMAKVALADMPAVKLAVRNREELSPDFPLGESLRRPRLGPRVSNWTIAINNMDSTPSRRKRAEES